MHHHQQVVSVIDLATNTVIQVVYNWRAAPAMIPLPSRVPALTLAALVPVPEPLMLLTSRIPRPIVVPSL